MNIITRLIMDSAQYSGGLEKAQKSLDKYVEKNMTLDNVGKNVIGTIDKIASSIGLAVGAQQAFDKVMHSSQITGDAFDNTMNACKGTVDAFFQSLSNGNWDAFRKGISGVLSDMYELSALRDSFNDAKLSMGFNTRVFESEFARLEGIVDDQTKSKSERTSAFNEMQSLIENFQRDVNDTAAGTADLLIKSLNSRFGRNDFNISDINKYISITNNDFSTRKEQQDFLAYKEKLDSLEEKRYKYYKIGGGVFSGTSQPVEDKNIVKQIEDLKAANKELEKQNILKNDNDKSRLQMINDYQYLLEMQQKGGEFFKRSLEKQNTISGLSNASNNKLSGVDAKEQWTGELVLNAYIQKTAETQLDDEIFKAIQGDKKLPVLMQPVQELIEGGMNEGPEEVEDPALEGLRDRIGMYDTIQQKIASYKDMLKYANEEEAGYIQSQIAMWEEYANKIGLAVDKGDDLGAITGIIGQIGGALSSTGNDWLSYIGNSVSAMAGLLSAIQSQTQAYAALAVARQAGGKLFPLNIAAVASTLAVITSAMSSISSIGNFAEGGIVGGTNYQDGITARVSSGEMFINQADQKKLYDSIHSGNLGGGNGRAVVTGEQIVIAANNWGKRTGRGELLFSK